MTDRHDLPDGIYFNLPHEVYLALPRLGSTAIKDLRTSTATFWQNSWLNPRHAESAETKAQEYGTVFHTARLEPQRFAAGYVRDFDPRDHLDAIATDAELRSALAEEGLVQSMKDETTIERALRYKRLVGERPVLSLLRHQFYMDLSEDVTPISSELWDRATLASERMRAQPEIEALLSDGAPEVSILWTERDIRFRARLDWLSASHWADLKSFSNPRGKPVDQCVLDAFRFNGYYMQAVHNDAAVETMRSGGLEIQDSAAADDKKLVAAVRRRQGPLQCYYIFSQSDDSPNILAREIALRGYVKGAEAQSLGADDIAPFMTQPTRLMMRGALERERAVKVFLRCLEVYGEDEPWGPLQPIGEISDADFHDNWLDGEGS